MQSNYRHSIASPVERTTRTTRVITPKANRLAQQQTKIEKPKLSATQQLEILNRIENRDFARDLGFSQFYETNNGSKYGSLKKNLMRDFESSRYSNADREDDTKSTVGGDSFLSSTRIPKAGGILEGEEQEAKEECEDDEFMNNEDYSRLPADIKKLHDHAVINICASKLFQQMAEYTVKTIFCRQFPQSKIVNLLYSVQWHKNLLRTFLKKRVRDKLQFFHSQREKIAQLKNNILRCAVRDQPKVITAIQKLTNLQVRVKAVVDRLNEENVEEKLRNDVQDGMERAQTLADDLEKRGLLEEEYADVLDKSISLLPDEDDFNSTDDDGSDCLDSLYSEESD